MATHATHHTTSIIVQDDGPAEVKVRHYSVGASDTNWQATLPDGVMLYAQNPERLSVWLRSIADEVDRAAAEMKAAA